MDHGTPSGFHQSQFRPAPGMIPWRAVNPHPHPHPPPHHYRNHNYGLYQQQHLQGASHGSHPAWPDQRSIYYPHHPASITDRRRPASRAELYERSEPYRPIPRQGYDERYGFYEAVHRDNSSNRGNSYESPFGVSAEKDWRTRTHHKPVEYWVQDSSTMYYPEQNIERAWPDAQNWTQSSEDNNSWYPDQRRCGSAMDRLEQPFSSPRSNLLSQYRDSGMSSSSYELSQYMQDPADLIDPWNPLQNESTECSPQPTAPMKFSLPHVTVCFGARGQLVRVCPNFPDEGQPALVEIHSMEVLLHDTLEQEEMRRFPGPLQREDLHKLDVMTYCQQNVSHCLRSQSPRSRDEALLWQVLLQMCRQNGRIAGTDVAELLLQDRKRERYQKEEQYSDLIHLSEDTETHLLPDGAQVDLLTGESPFTAESSARALEKFTKLLFFGRKKEALDWAMKNHLWGHALFLSSKMDSRAYSLVMARFTSTLSVNDPLQTLFQLMAGRIPQSATCSGDTKWGDWRPHLAVMLSNQMADPEVNQRAIVTMGDHLVLKGLTAAGHCCYLTAGISFGQFYEKSDRLVLLGSHQNQSFKKFACTASIQRTEILEYCQRLGISNYCIPSFQIYKLLYASRLLDYGLTSVALHYCECIASAILSNPGSFGSLVVIQELIKLAERLRYSDPQLLECSELEQNQEPTWLAQLRVMLQTFQESDGVGVLHPVACDNRGNETETSEISASAENQQAYEDDDRRSAPDNVGVEHGWGDSHVPQFTQMPPAETKTGNNCYWDIQQLAPTSEVPIVYSTNDSPQEQENIDDFPEPPWQSSSVGDNGLMEAARMSRRVSAVSESSTVSMEDDDSDTSQEDPPPRKPDTKKGSTFGWFSWFRSKEAKAAEIPPSDRQTPAKSLSQADLPPGAGDKPRPSLLHPPGHMTLETRNSPPRAAGMKEHEEVEEINGSPVLPDTLGQQENMAIYPNAPGPGSQINQSAGAVPLYNPSQFFQNTGRVANKPSHPARGRYPLQPR